MTTMTSPAPIFNRTRPMRMLTRVSDRIERASGLPGRFMLPAATAGIALQIALLGMYLDIAAHVDRGRDGSLFTLPHTLIVVGLQGIVFAALLHALLGGPRARGERALPLGLSLSPGGVQVLACGAIALMAFPLDAVWHSLFGEDATLWGPTHLFMIGGASLSTLGVWMLIRHAFELGDMKPRPSVPGIRSAQARIAGGLLIGMSTFQAEFDFGVPQFQLLVHPVLIAIAAGLALPAAVSLFGRGAALRAVAFFLLLRGALALLIGPVLGMTTPVMALYVVEALAVEAAFVVSRGDARRLALLSGLGIGTVGLASEWGWTAVVHDHAWTASMLPEAAVLALVGATGAAVLGVRIAQALARPAQDARPLATLPARSVAFAGAAVLVAIAVCLPRTGGDGTIASVVPTPAGDGKVRVAVALDPPDAARGAEWFEVLSWQGRERSRHTALREIAPGRFEAVAPVPVGGNWKSMVRLAEGSHLMATPVYLSGGPVRSEEPAVARSGPMTADTYVLQREATGGAAWLETMSYSLLGLITAGWLAVTCWSLRLAAAPAGGAAAARRRRRRLVVA